MCVFFALTDRVSPIPGNMRGCQSGTWSVGQEHVQSSNESVKKKKKKKAKTAKKKEKKANAGMNR